MEHDHDLLAYLLQGLEPDEERATEAHLEGDPAARKELQKWRRLLDPLNHMPPVEPPATLYMNTLRAVAGQIVQTRGPVFPARDESGDGAGRWWRRADVLVAIAAIFVLALLIPPILVYVRHRQDMLACQQNLYKLHQSYKQYWEMNNNALPNLGDLEPPIRVAGMHPVMLREKKCWNPDISLVCPGVGSGGFLVLQDRSEALEKVLQGDQNWMAQVGGQYAYSLGYFQDERLCGLTRDMDGETPYLADRSPLTLVGTANSPNHGGRGQNVLFLGGHVRWMTGRMVGEDDIYLNADGKLEAGRNAKDFVLGASETRPEPLKKTD